MSEPKTASPTQTMIWLLAILVIALGALLIWYQKTTHQQIQAHKAEIAEKGQALATVQTERAGLSDKLNALVRARFESRGSSVAERSRRIDHIVQKTLAPLRAPAPVLHLAIPPRASEYERAASEMIEQTTLAAKEISAATQQQKSATDQVVKAMREVASVAQQTAAGGRQVAGSAEQLAAIAKESSQVGSAFKIVD